MQQQRIYYSFLCRTIDKSLKRCITMSTENNKLQNKNNSRHEEFVRKELGLKHLFDGSDLNVYNDKITNLGVGAPGPDLLKKCCEIFNKATKHRMETEFNSNAYLFQYGPVQGTLEVRSTLATFLTEAYNDKVYKEDLLITTGATHGLHLILSSLIDMDGFIFVDDVTYMIALESFSQFTNMKILPVKLNDDGTDINDLKNLLEKHKFNSKNKLFWGMYYTIPTYHNPTGILFSEDVCKKLIKLSREYNILIACDDVYNLLHYNTNKSPKRLFAYDNVTDIDYNGNVISNGTFSKIIAPGIRLGWMECPQNCIKLFNNNGILKSGGCTNNYTSGILTSMIQMNLLKSHINDNMYTNYKLRMNTFCDILINELPQQCKFIKPNGGYFIWIQLPEYIDGNDFNKFCIENYQIFTIPGNRFSIENKFSNYLRISIAFHSDHVLKDAAKRLCNALKMYITKNK